MSKFWFESFDRDICQGNFKIDETYLRNLFLNINLDKLGVYGMRIISPDNTVSTMGLFDPQRKKIEDLCQKYGRREIDFSEFQKLFEPKSGVIINSPQNEDSPYPNLFNDLASRFITNLNLSKNKYPEIVDIIIFIGSYSKGFNIHIDFSDVAMFVVDGRKNFMIREDGNDRIYTVEKNQYLRWRSIYEHSNHNDNNDWSISFHISVGPKGKRKAPPGAPVEYIYDKTELCNYLEEEKIRQQMNNSCSKT